MKKSVLLTGILALASISIAYSKYVQRESLARYAGRQRATEGRFLRSEGGWRQGHLRRCRFVQEVQRPGEGRERRQEVRRTKIETTGSGNVRYVLKDIQSGGSTTADRFLGLRPRSDPARGAVRLRSDPRDVRLRSGPALRAVPRCGDPGVRSGAGPADVGAESGPRQPPICLPRAPRHGGLRRGPGTGRRWGRRRRRLFRSGRLLARAGPGGWR